MLFLSPRDQAPVYLHTIASNDVCSQIKGDLKRRLSVASVRPTSRHLYLELRTSNFEPQSNAEAWGFS